MVRPADVCVCRCGMPTISAVRFLADGYVVHSADLYALNGTVLTSGCNVTCPECSSTVMFTNPSTWERPQKLFRLLLKTLMHRTK
jgi:hypothetical protein